MHLMLRIGMVLVLSGWAVQQASAQVGWHLDTTFRMPYSPEGINSIHEKADGSLLLSGGIHFPEDVDEFYHRSIAHVFTDGSVDDDFPDFPLTGGGVRSRHGTTSCTSLQAA